jgi:hypothetical protein
MIWLQDFNFPKCNLSHIFFTYFWILICYTIQIQVRTVWDQLVGNEAYVFLNTVCKACLNNEKIHLTLMCSFVTWKHAVLIFSTLLEFLRSCCAYRISQVVSNCDHCMGYCRKEMCCVEKWLLDMWGVTTGGSCYFTSVNSESITHVRWGWKTRDKEGSWWWIKIMFTPCGLINGQCTTKMHTHH